MKNNYLHLEIGGAERTCFYVLFLAQDGICTLYISCSRCESTPPKANTRHHFCRAAAIRRTGWLCVNLLPCIRERSGQSAKSAALVLVWKPQSARSTPLSSATAPLKKPFLCSVLVSLLSVHLHPCFCTWHFLAKKQQRFSCHIHSKCWRPMISFPSCQCWLAKLLLST